MSDIRTLILNDPDLAQLTRNRNAIGERFATGLLSRLNEREQTEAMISGVSSVYAALDESERLGLIELSVTAMPRLASILRNQGRYDEAKALIHKAESLAQAHDKSSDLLTAWHQQGIIEGKSGRLQEAEHWLNKTLELARKIGDQVVQFDTYNSLGTLAYVQGDFSHAKKWWENTIALAEQINLENRASAVYSNLALLAEHELAYNKAERYLTKAVSLAQTYQQPVQAMNALVNVVAVQMFTGQFKQALLTVDELEQQALTLEAVENRVYANYYRAWILALEHAYPQAKEHAQRAVSLAKNTPIPFLLIECRSLLGYIVSQTGELDIADTTFSQALEGARELLDHPLTLATVLIRLAESQFSLGNIVSAKKHLQELLSLAEAHGFQATAVEAKFLQARMAKKEGLQADALQLATECLTIFSAASHYLKTEAEQFIAEAVYDK